MSMYRALRPDRGGRADKHIRGGEGGDGAACRYPGSLKLIMDREIKNPKAR